MIVLPSAHQFGQVRTSDTDPHPIRLPIPLLLVHYPEEKTESMTEVNSDDVLVTYDGVRLQMSSDLSAYFEKNPEQLISFVDQMKRSEAQNVPQPNYHKEVSKLTEPSTPSAPHTKTTSLTPVNSTEPRPSTSVQAGSTEVPVTLPQNDKINWNQNTTKLLISERVEADSLFQGKMSHKVAWRKVSEKINFIQDIGVSGEQCQWKWNKLVQKYKECCDHNSKSGNDPKTFDFMDQLDSFLGTAPNVTPTITISSMASGGDGEEKMVEKGKGKKRRAVKSDTLEFLKEMKEDRERQHRETLNAFMQIQQQKMALAREALEFEKTKYAAQRGEL